MSEKAWPNADMALVGTGGHQRPEGHERPEQHRHCAGQMGAGGSVARRDPQLARAARPMTRNPAAGRGWSRRRKKIPPLCVVKEGCRRWTPGSVCIALWPFLTWFTRTLNALEADEAGIEARIQRITVLVSIPSRRPTPSGRFNATDTSSRGWLSRLRLVALPSGHSNSNDGLCCCNSWAEHYEAFSLFVSHVPGGVRRSRITSFSLSAGVMGAGSNSRSIGGSL